MSGFPFFSLEDTCDIEERQYGGDVPLFIARGEVNTRRSRLRRVRWLTHQRIVVLKEVGLWAADCVTECVDVVAERLWRVHTDASRNGRAHYLAEYLALHVDSSHHYQWLLSSYGPSLRDVLLTPSLTPFTEERCKGVLRRVLLALDQLHRVSMYVHADVSLGNVLTSPSSSEDVVLGDLESVSPIGAVPRGCLGSYLFMAPERLVDGGLPLAPHDDIWAFGVVCYNLLTWDVTHPWCTLGADPNYSENYWAFLDLMSKAKDVLPCQLLLQSPLSRCSREALMFVAVCLSWNPTCRPSALELLQHSWMLSR
ncbi:protein kinase, putative [Leishmania tarentolae]|uniref:Protein kinase, putative n=1 Tax=Leishmania tarentolae TaxID=5689 RepID=A0A640KEN2_LEITA|nr:protein kinase, putative [Leishmania tarentolae]